jgi:hypothetical protein
VRIDPTAGRSKPVDASRALEKAFGSTASGAPIATPGGATGFPAPAPVEIAAKPSTALGAERVNRVASVAALVRVPDVGDVGFGAFHLDLERGNQRVFRVHDDVAALALHPKADGELHLRPPASLFAT